VAGVLGAAAGAFLSDGEGAGAGACEGSGCAGAGAGCGAGACWACAGGAGAGCGSCFEQPLRRRAKKSSAMKPRVMIFIALLYSEFRMKSAMAKCGAGIQKLVLVTEEKARGGGKAEMQRLFASAEATGVGAGAKVARVELAGAVEGFAGVARIGILSVGHAHVVVHGIVPWV